MRNYGIACLFLLLATFTSCNESENEIKPDPSSEQEITASDAKETKKAIEKTITGTVNGTPFTGTLRVYKFINKDSSVYALANITKIKGELSKATKRTLSANTYEFPVSFPQSTGASSNERALATCDVLFLQLGPLDLDLLGLTVHLDQVTLDINAESGSGNLLGNLLCAIAGLFDPLGAITDLLQLIDLLNQLVDLIGTF